jgi:hypothetical protein
MAISRFTGDEDKDEINHVEWLRMVKQYCKTHFWASLQFDGEACKWWDNLDESTRISPTRENFEKLFSNKWIKDTNREEMYKIQVELKEAKEEIKKKGDDLSKI